MPVDLRSGGRDWIYLSQSSLWNAQGRLNPRLTFGFYAETRHEALQARILQFNAELTMASDNEVLGYGSVQNVGMLVRHRQTQLFVDMRVGRDAIEYIQQRFREPTAFLELRFSGLLQVRDDRPGTESGYQGELSRGEWHYAPLDSGMSNGRIQLHKSEWISRVLQPLGFGEHILLDIPVPSIPEREHYLKALGHLKRADEQFAQGDDPGVFSSCRAAFEALDGAPKNIFDRIEDEGKRRRVDQLLREAVAYYHAGRHVSKSGPQQGEFPVDHRDAEFALAQAKLLLSYTAKLLVQQA